MFTWDDVKYFLAFARTGSMVAAANALGVNQTTVQRRLVELDERLGRRLVARHRGGYRLTQAGEELRRSAERIEEAVVAFERDVAASDNGLTGTVRVTTIGCIVDRLGKAPLIDEFHLRYPSLRLQFVVTDRVLDLAKGEADLAIRAGVPRDEALVGRKIVDVPWAVYAGRLYIEQHGAPLRVEDIDRHFVVVCGDLECTSTKWLRSVAPNLKVAARCESGYEQLRLMKAGAGLAPLPVNEADNDLIRLIDDIGLVTPYYLLMHRDMQQTPRVRAFADFVAAKIKAFRAVIS
jgi:DNA-binding transcriptional LysR family regulator